MLIQLPTSQACRSPVSPTARAPGAPRATTAAGRGATNGGPAAPPRRRPPGPRAAAPAPAAPQAASPTGRAARRSRTCEGGVQRPGEGEGRVKEEFQRMHVAARPRTLLAAACWPRGKAIHPTNRSPASPAGCQTAVLGGRQRGALSAPPPPPLRLGPARQLRVARPVGGHIGVSKLLEGRQQQGGAAIQRGTFSSSCRRLRGKAARRKGKEHGLVPSPPCSAPP